MIKSTREKRPAIEKIPYYVVSSGQHGGKSFPNPLSLETSSVYKVPAARETSVLDQQNPKDVMPKVKFRWLNLLRTHRGQSVGIQGGS